MGSRRVVRAGGSDATGGSPGGPGRGGPAGAGGPPTAVRRGWGERVPALARGALVAALAAACWFAWLGWDTTYQLDAAGVASGPYEAWQVAGCVASLAAVVVLGTVAAGALVTVVLVTGSFTFAWSSAASSDPSGLWLVGALLVLLGTAFGSSALAWLTTALLVLRRTSRVARGG